MGMEIEFTKKQETMFIIVLGLGGLMSSFNSTNVYIALPTIMKYFNIGMTTMQWAIIGYMVASCLVMPVAGYLIDRFSGRKMFFYSTIILLLSSLVCIFSPNYAVFALGRLIQGIAAGIMITVPTAIVYQFITPERQLRAVSLISPLNAIGVALGPSISGFFVNSFGWRSIFVINVPILAFMIVLTLKYIPYKVFPVAHKFDLMGLATAMFGTVGILIGFNQGNVLGWTSPITLGLIGSGVVFLIFFVWHEMHIGNPMLSFSVFQYSGFAMIFVFNCFHTFATSSASTFMPLFLQNVIGLNALVAGIALIIPATCMTIATPFSAKLQQIFSAKGVIIGSSIILLLGTWQMSRFTIATTVVGLVFWLSVRYIGLGLVTPILHYFAMASVPTRITSHAAAMFNWTRQMVFTISVSLLTLLYDAEMIRGVEQGVAADLGIVDQLRFIECMAIDKTNICNVIMLVFSLIVVVFLKEKMLHHEK